MTTAARRSTTTQSMIFPCCMMLMKLEFKHVQPQQLAKHVVGNCISCVCRAPHMRSPTTPRQLTDCLHRPQHNPPTTTEVTRDKVPAMVSCRKCLATISCKH
ncbi:uncharacterized protein LOC131264160 [Anopheles coustani]|uniref:uncharacterized protein LOC131264160 n=1 Tax=Anopheles coustani TaxID=139045 RepID=UPI002659974E|nr:uncharacterized protein LOC131264160 [Anopheles coustani]